MKRTFLIICLTILMIGCNLNPSKEERIQKLEKEIVLTNQKVKELENKVKRLEELYQEIKQD